MNYSGKLYGKIGKKYFPMEKTSDDIDNELKAANDSVAVLKRENEELKKIIKSPEMLLMGSEFPKKFPKELQEQAVKLVNDNVPWGCCGGCV